MWTVLPSLSKERTWVPRKSEAYLKKKNETSEAATRVHQKRPGGSATELRLFSFNYETAEAWLTPQIYAEVIAYARQSVMALDGC